MSRNSFNGIIPSGLGRLTGLSLLNLQYNQLQASDHSSWQFLDALTNCSQLERLFLAHNKLSGKLPSSIANLSIIIQKLVIHFNQISGNIPLGICNLINLRVLALGPNLLTGVVPKSIGNLVFLQALELDHNMLTGTIPSSIGNLTQMVYLYLHINDFSGHIPPSIGNLKSLAELYLDGNNLNGNIPKELLRLPNILILNLAINSLIGSIPSEIGGLKYLIEFYVYENKLFDEIPSSISGCVSLEVLHLHSNLIQGTIPSSLGDLKSLIQLDLSDNKLTGQIPEALGTLRGLEYLNFSFNHLFGEVPIEGIFLNATKASLQENCGLCGGVSNFHLPACPHIILSEKRRRLPLLAILLPSMAAFSLILFSIFCFICKRTNLNKISSKPKIMEDIYPKVSYGELARATNGFSPANLLGIGQYGSVYKGSLNDYSYTTVAVKVFNLQQRGASGAFTAECEALRRIRHRNLLKILTCCVSIDAKGNDFMAIIFEFMPNGNLDTWLHTEDHMMEHLDLIKRLDIAINIADALCYLHHELETPIIHCDLKPSNVLLDGDMVAHMGDFGLARLLNRVGNNPLNDSDQSSSVIKGSIGYAAPEYGVASQVSTMGDVYSYGILLLELFTGRRPIDRIFKDGLNLHKFVEMAIPNRLIEVIDPNLQLQFKDEVEIGIQSRRAIYKCLISILQLSLSCSKESIRERISWRGELVPHAEQYIREISSRKDQFIVRQSVPYKVEVEGSCERHEVGIHNRECSCRIWQLTGPPCIHVVAFVGSKHQPSWHMYVDEHYQVIRYKLSYQGEISTLHSKEQWQVINDSVEIGVPNILRPRGRPRKRRLKIFLENKSTKAKSIHKCSRCGEWDHHRSTCKNPLTHVQKSLMSTLRQFILYHRS